MTSPGTYLDCRANIKLTVASDIIVPGESFLPGLDTKAGGKFWVLYCLITGFPRSIYLCFCIII